MTLYKVELRDCLIIAGSEELNAAGGVLGMSLEPIILDGASDWLRFARQARRLLVED